MRVWRSGAARSALSTQVTNDNRIPWWPQQHHAYTHQKLRRAGCLAVSVKICSAQTRFSPSLLPVFALPCPVRNQTSLSPDFAPAKFEDAEALFGDGHDQYLAAESKKKADDFEEKRRALKKSRDKEDAEIAKKREEEDNELAIAEAAMKKATEKALRYEFQAWMQERRIVQSCSMSAKYLH
jgi:hypothetical protein